MTKSFLKYGAWSLGVIAGVFTVGTAIAAAATTIVSPHGGACYEGGGSITIRWTTNDLFHHHSYVSYGRTATPAPKYNQPSNIPGGQNTGKETSLHWDLPKLTGADYTVYVASLSGLNSLNSAATTEVFGIDASRPSQPKLAIRSITATSIQLSWSRSSDAGCQKLSGYKLYRNGKLVKTTTARSFTDQDLQPATNYRYMVMAYDSFATTKSTSLNIYTPALATRQQVDPTEQLVDKSGGTTGGDMASGTVSPSKRAAAKSSSESKNPALPLSGQDTGLRGVYDSIMLNNSSVQSVEPSSKERPNLVLLAATGLVLGTALMIAKVSHDGQLQYSFGHVPQLIAAVRRKFDWRAGITNKFVGGLLYATTQIRPARKLGHKGKSHRTRRKKR